VHWPKGRKKYTSRSSNWSEKPGSWVGRRGFALEKETEVKKEERKNAGLRGGVALWGRRALGGRLGWGIERTQGLEKGPVR